MTSHRRRRVGLRKWWKTAQALAMLALLANALLLPALHRFSGGTPASAGSEASHHRAAHGDGEQERQGSTDHQVCHFCRLLEAALPQPPSVAVELSFLATAEWAITDTVFPRPKGPRATKLPRAPPPRG